jgi:hypothetical protein
MNDEYIEKAIAYLYQYREYLSEWEDNFIDNVRNQWDRRHWLSEGQLETLGNLYERKKGKIK